MVKINTNKIFFSNRATIYKHQYTATQVRVTELVKLTYIYMFSTHFSVMFQPQIQYYCVKQLWALQQGLFTKQTLHEVSGSRDSSVVEHRTCHGKVVGLSPSRSGRRIFFSRVNFLCRFSFWYLFHPLVTTVAYNSVPILIWVSVPPPCYLPQWHIKDPSHSAKSASDRSLLNTHEPYICGFEVAL